VPSDRSHTRAYPSATRPPSRRCISSRDNRSFSQADRRISPAPVCHTPARYLAADRRHTGCRRPPERGACAAHRPTTLSRQAPRRRSPRAAARAACCGRRPAIPHGVLSTTNSQARPALAARRHAALNARPCRRVRMVGGHGAHRRWHGSRDRHGASGHPDGSSAEDLRVPLRVIRGSLPGTLTLRTDGPRGSIRPMRSRTPAQPRIARRTLARPRVQAPAINSDYRASVPSDPDAIIG
jgi:hypothetical protein